MSRPFTAGLVSGASVMIRREVIRQVGDLDDRLFYHIDADYCRRIWDAGWKVYYLPSASIIHLSHQGGSMVSFRRRVRSVSELRRPCCSRSISSLQPNYHAKSWPNLGRPSDRMFRFLFSNRPRYAQVVARLSRPES